MNQNSIDTYHKIKSSGLLSGRRFDVYECIYHWGPISGNEVMDRLGLKTNNTGRLTELREMGAIKATGIAENSAGNPETLWVVTGKLPGKLEKVDARERLIKRIQSDMTKLSEHLTEKERVGLRCAYSMMNKLK